MARAWRNMSVEGGVEWAERQEMRAAEGGGAEQRGVQADGERVWTCVRQADSSSDPEFSAYVDRRRSQDSDLWIVELDIAQGERFIGLTSADS